MCDTRVFRIWSGIFFLLSALTNIFTVNAQLFRISSNNILNLFFLNLLPGIASLILAKPKRANNVVLTVLLGVCLFENILSVLISLIKNIGLISVFQGKSGYLIASGLLDFCLPLLICLIAAICSLTNTGEYAAESMDFEMNRGKKAAGILRIVTGGLLGTAVLAAIVVIVFFSRLGWSDSQYAFIWLPAVFAVILVTSGIISIRAASRQAVYIGAEVYSFMMIVVFFAKGMLQLLFSFLALGGSLMQGSGDVVIVRFILVFLLILAFLVWFTRLIILFVTFLQKRRSVQHVG